VIGRTLLCSVRLAGGLSSREGNLEVFHKGVWGAVCVLIHSISMTLPHRSFALRSVSGTAYRRLHRLYLLIGIYQVFLTNSRAYW